MHHLEPNLVVHSDAPIRLRGSNLFSACHVLGRHDESPRQNPFQTSADRSSRFDEDCTCYLVSKKVGRIKTALGV